VVLNGTGKERNALSVPSKRDGGIRYALLVVGRPFIMRWWRLARQAALAQSEVDRRISSKVTVGTLSVLDGDSRVQGA
jgi:hypothetical protein